MTIATASPVEDVETRSNSEPESPRIVRAVIADARVLRGERSDDVGRSVRARVVDDENLVVECGALERLDDAARRSRDGAGFIVAQG